MLFLLDENSILHVLVQQKNTFYKLDVHLSCDRQLEKCMILMW